MTLGSCRKYFCQMIRNNFKEKKNQKIIGKKLGKYAVNRLLYLKQIFKPCTAGVSNMWPRGPNWPKKLPI